MLFFRSSWNVFSGQPCCLFPTFATKFVSRLAGRSFFRCGGQPAFFSWRLGPCSTMQDSSSTLVLLRWFCYKILDASEAPSFEDIQDVWMVAVFPLVSQSSVASGNTTDMYKYSLMAFTMSSHTNVLWSWWKTPAVLTVLVHTSFYTSPKLKMLLQTYVKFKTYLMFCTSRGIGGWGWSCPAVTIMVVNGRSKDQPSLHAHKDF